MVRLINLNCWILKLVSIMASAKPCWLLSYIYILSSKDFGLSYRSLQDFRESIHVFIPRKNLLSDESDSTADDASPRLTPSARVFARSVSHQQQAYRKFDGAFSGYAHCWQPRCLEAQLKTKGRQLTYMGETFCLLFRTPSSLYMTDTYCILRMFSNPFERR